MNWVDFEDFERAREWINEPQPHQVEDGSFCDSDEPTSWAAKCRRCGVMIMTDGPEICEACWDEAVGA